MKKIIVAVMALLLTACKQEDNRFWVYGDSIVAWKDSWIYQMHEGDALVAHNMAISGNSWKANTLWQMQLCGRNSWTRHAVIVSLGINDIWAHADEVYPYAAEQLAWLQERGCEVYVIPPPAEISPRFKRLTARWHEVRNDIIRASAHHGAKVIEVTIDWDQTIFNDQLHPNLNGHTYLDVQIRGQLDLAWKAGG